MERYSIRMGKLSSSMVNGIRMNADHQHQVDGAGAAFARDPRPNVRVPHHGTGSVTLVARIVKLQEGPSDGKTGLSRAAICAVVSAPWRSQSTWVEFWYRLARRR